MKSKYYFYIYYKYYCKNKKEFIVNSRYNYSDIISLLVDNHDILCNIEIISLLLKKYHHNDALYLFNIILFKKNKIYEINYILNNTKNKKKCLEQCLLFIDEIIYNHSEDYAIKLMKENYFCLNTLFKIINTKNKKIINFIINNYSTLLNYKDLSSYYDYFIKHN